MSKSNTKAKADAPETSEPSKRSDEVRVGKRSSDDMKAIGGSGYELWDSELLYRAAQAAPQWQRPGEEPGDGNRRNAGVAALALHAFAPQDAIESMIAAQAVALHFATMECTRRAMVPQQSPDVSSKLRKDAANTARAMVEMCEALDRRRGKGGQQRIVVERVVVNGGGQALVAGSVVGGGALPASSPSSPAISQSAPPMPMLDVEPVAVGVGEEERDARSDG